MTPALKLILFGSARPTLSKIIASLFSATSDGAVYETADLSSVYQENTGITAGAVGSSNGLTLDQRSALARGSEIIPTVADQTGSSDTGYWTKDTGVTVSTGFVWTAAANTNSLYRTGVLTAGVMYEVTWTVSTISAGGLSIGAVQIGVGGTFGATKSSTGTYREMILCPAGATAMEIRAVGITTAKVTSISWKAVPDNHASQSVASSRPIETAYGIYTGALFDGVDDGLSSVTGGAGTTGFFWCGAVKVVGGDGTSRSVWSDVGTNTGYRVRIASTNNLALGAGNGTTFTSATSTDSVLAGNTYVLTAWDDGTNLNVQVNSGAIVQAARPTVSAGGAGFSLGKDNNGSTAFANIALFEMFYKKNGSDVSAADRLKCQKYCAAKAGVTL